MFFFRVEVVPSAGLLLFLLFLTGCCCTPLHRGRSAKNTTLAQSEEFQDYFMSTVS